MLADRWTEVLAAEEYKLERPSKSYPKRRLLPQLEEEATKPTSPMHDPMAATERPLSPPLKPHPDAAQKLPRHGKMRQTCEIYWRTRQGKQDRSTDRVGAPHHVTITVTPDMINMARLNTTDKAHPSYVTI